MSHAVAGSVLDDLPPDLPPTSLPDEVVEENRRLKPRQIIIWGGIALLGAVAWAMIATARKESINGVWFVFAAVCSYLIAYRFYATFIEKVLVKPDDTRANHHHIHAVHEPRNRS